MKLDWEHLGGDGQHALQTPLATLHAFNGWDDQFLVTPAGGLDDRYLALNDRFDRRTPPGGLGWTVGYHDYRSKHSGRFGHERDAAFSFPLMSNIHGQLKMADYRAKGYGRENAKLRLQLEWRGHQALGAAR